MTKPKRVITIESKGVRGVHQLPANVTPGPGVGVQAYRGTVIGNNGFSRSTTSVIADFNDAMVGLKRGAENGQRIYALKTLMRIADKLGEVKLLEAISTLSEEVLLDKNASLLLRTNAIERVVEIYERVVEMRKAKAERDGEDEVLIGSAKKEGAAQAGLPAFNAEAVRAAALEKANAGTNIISYEEKMAIALLRLLNSGPNEENEYVTAEHSEYIVAAAAEAIDSLDSPILVKIMASCNLAKDGSAVSPYLASGTKIA